jgi:hypothetical protein
LSAASDEDALPYARRSANATDPTAEPKQSAGSQALAKHDPPAPKAEDGGAAKPAIKRTQKAALKSTTAKTTTTKSAAGKSTSASADQLMRG